MSLSKNNRCHALDDMQARQECMDTMRELFRQFM